MPLVEKIKSRVALSPIAELLDDLAHVPHLPGARCRGRSRLFDLTIPGAATPREVIAARRQARKICEQCPALAACAAWIETLPPPLQPRGIVAGRADVWHDPQQADAPLTRIRWWTGGSRWPLARGSVSSPATSGGSVGVGLVSVQGPTRLLGPVSTTSMRP
jgi:hypothetical protein